MATCASKYIDHESLLDFIEELAKEQNNFKIIILYYTFHAIHRKFSFVLYNCYSIVFYRWIYNRNYKSLRPSTSANDCRGHQHLGKNHSSKCQFRTALCLFCSHNVPAKFIPITNDCIYADCKSHHRRHHQNDRLNILCTTCPQAWLSVFGCCSARDVMLFAIT